MKQVIVKLTDRQLTVKWGLPDRILRHWRYISKKTGEKVGPPFVHEGRLVYYILHDAEMWLAEVKTDEALLRKHSIIARLLNEGVI